MNLFNFKISHCLQYLSTRSETMKSDAAVMGCLFHFCLVTSYCECCKKRRQRNCDKCIVYDSCWTIGFATVVILFFTFDKSAYECVIISRRLIVIKVALKMLSSLLPKRKIIIIKLIN